MVEGYSKTLPRGISAIKQSCGEDFIGHLVTANLFSWKHPFYAVFLAIRHPNKSNFSIEKKATGSSSLGVQPTSCSCAWVRFNVISRFTSGPWLGYHTIITNARRSINWQKWAWITINDQKTCCSSCSFRKKSLPQSRATEVRSRNQARGAVLRRAIGQGPESLQRSLLRFRRGFGHVSWDKNIPPDRKPRARFHFFSAEFGFRYSETVILKSQKQPKNGSTFGGFFL